MKIVEGRYYRTRDGRKVGPMHTTPPEWGYDAEWAWTDREKDDDQMGDNLWRNDGSCDPHGKPDSCDLIAEWSDPVDLTAITTPFGLLDRETQEALKAHGGPYEVFSVTGWWLAPEASEDWSECYAYRVKPAPAKARTIYLCEVHGTRTVFDTAIAATREAMEYQHGEARVTEWEEKLK